MKPTLKSFRLLPALTGSALAATLILGSTAAWAGPVEKFEKKTAKAEKKAAKAEKKANKVPEISGEYAGSALALVLGGAAVVLGRRRKVS